MTSRLRTLLLVVSLSPVALGLFGHSTNIDDPKKDIVPGANPLNFCASPSEYILNIAYVDLIPNPPEAGKTLTVKASGNVTEKIEAGAHARIAIKLKLNYGGQIPIITRDADICEMLKNDDEIEEKCPIDKDEEITITKTVDIPAQVPKGTFVVLIDAYTKDENKITCMEAELAFK